jgi:hypothetical protein
VKQKCLFPNALRFDIRLQIDMSLLREWHECFTRKPLAPVHIYNIIYIIVVVFISIHSVQCVLYCVHSFVCCVLFDRGVILCDVCYLFVECYCKPLPPGKNPFAVNKYYITYNSVSYLHIPACFAGRRRMRALSPEILYFHQNWHCAKRNLQIFSNRTKYNVGNDRK